LKNGLNKFFPMFMCAIPRKYIHLEYGEMGVKVMWIFISVKLSKCFPQRVYPATTALSHTKLNYRPQGPIEHQCIDGVKSYIHAYFNIYQNTGTTIIIIIFLCTYTFLGYQVTAKKLTTWTDARTPINLRYWICTWNIFANTKYELDLFFKFIN